MTSEENRFYGPDPLVITSLLVNGGSDFRTVNMQAQEIERRLGVLRTLALNCRSADVVLLPAGFLCARGASAARQLADQADESLRAAKAQATFIYGVDGWCGKKHDRPLDTIVYPYFVAISRPEAKRPTILRQIATSAEEGRQPTIMNQRWICDAGDRRLIVNGHVLSILICGETWSPQLRAKVCEVKPMVVIIPAHQAIKKGRGKRSWENPLCDLVRCAEASVVVAEHTRSGGMSPRVWGTAKIQGPTWEPDLQAWVVTATVLSGLPSSHTARRAR